MSIILALLRVRRAEFSLEGYDPVNPHYHQT